MNHPNKTIMEKAIKLTLEKHAVAAIVVKNDQIIAESFTSIDENQDPTCHAEINAIRAACNQLKSKTLENCYLYSTLEPCPMCTTAAIWAKMAGIVYGANMDDETNKYHQRIKIRCFDVVKQGNPQLNVYPDFMRDECKKLLSNKL